MSQGALAPICGFPVLSPENEAACQNNDHHVSGLSDILVTQFLPCMQRMVEGNAQISRGEFRVTASISMHQATQLKVAWPDCGEASVAICYLFSMQSLTVAR